MFADIHALHRRIRVVAVAALPAAQRIGAARSNQRGDQQLHPRVRPAGGGITLRYDLDPVGEDFKALDDIDWRGGELVVGGKGRGNDPLPLLNDVGEALAAYLRDERPEASTRTVFLTGLAPLRGLKAAAVGHVVRRACERTGRAPVGPHRLRHALATEMLRRGVALPDLSQVLRHRDLATTQVYAKVDIAALRSVTRPWPQGQP